MPNMYARGILWGKMVLELGDACTARNDRNGYYADLQFKTKVCTCAIPIFSPKMFGHSACRGISRGRIMRLRGVYGREIRIWVSFRGSGVRLWSIGVLERYVHSLV